MLTILSNVFQTATRQHSDRHSHRRPLKTWEIERQRAEERRRMMRNVGMW